MRLYVKEIQQGIDGEVERLVEPFLTRVRQAFAARPGLSDPGDPTTDPVQLSGPGLAGVYRSRLLGDSGISVLTYGNGVNDIQYAGIEFRVNVLAAEDVVFAKYE
jgi:hypothetical protein